MCYSAEAQEQKQKKYELRYGERSYYPKPGPISGFTYPKIPVVVNGHHSTMQWGLLPSWAKDRDFAKNTLNAKIETLAEKPSFRNYLNNRCLLLFDAFYEWQWSDVLNPKCKKTKYRIERADNCVMSIAGLFSDWVDKETGEQLTTCTMVTTEAVGIMAEIHNSKHRMPVILNENEESNWLGGANHLLFTDRCAVQLIANTI